MDLAESVDISGFCRDLAQVSGGAGVVEVAYTATFVWALGDEYHTEVVAGVLVYRALTYLLPIITGAFCYGIWRWMRRKELRSATAAVPA